MNKQMKWMAASIALIVFYLFAAAGTLASSENESLGLGCILAVALAFIPANVAKKKGREFWAWYAYGILLGIVAIIHSVFLKTAPDATDQGESAGSTAQPGNAVPEQGAAKGKAAGGKTVAEADPSPSGGTNTQKAKFAGAIGVGAVALIILAMIFGVGPIGGGGKWSYSKEGPNGVGKWYIKFTEDNDAIFRLDVEGELPNYLIGMDFFMEEDRMGNEWTRMSSADQMGMDNFNENPELILTGYPIVSKMNGQWYVVFNGVELAELKRKGLVDFCWGEIVDEKLHSKIEYEDLDKYLK